MLTKQGIHEWYLDVMEQIQLSTLFITHNIDQALLLSDRILIMRSPTELLEIKPAKEYCSLSPDERIDTSEYKKLFFFFF